MQFLNADEIWLMVKPEDLQSIQGVSDGTYKKSEQNIEISLDKSEQKQYNNSDDKERRKARLRYHDIMKRAIDEDRKQREEERRKNYNQWKRNLKKGG